MYDQALVVFTIVMRCREYPGFKRKTMDTTTTDIVDIRAMFMARNDVHTRKKQCSVVVYQWAPSDHNLATKWPIFSQKK